MIILQSGIIEQFKEEEYDKSIEWHKNAEKKRLKFINDYPLDELRNMSLDEYTLKTNGFCHRIQYDLKDMASMGNVYPDAFGVYLTKDKSTPSLSKTYAKLYGEDYDAAFGVIKDDIVKLIEDIKNENYKAFDSNRLNSKFKFRLIITYVPGIIVPVIAKSTLKDYCERVGVVFDKNRSAILQNLALKEWKDAVPDISYWSNEVLMSFCEWLRSNEKKIDGSALQKESYTRKAKDVSEKIDNLNLVGEDRIAVVKTRVNQGVFKDRLLSRYKSCCLCNISNKDFLIASHIKPWSKSEYDERLDVDNGLLLCPNHDKLFDRGYITFDDNGQIIISEKLDRLNRLFMNITPEMTIELTSGNKKYLTYHRENVFNAS